MSVTPHKNKSKTGKDPLPVVIIVIAFVAVGIIAVSWVFIETLQDNSNKMRQYKIQQSPMITVRQTTLPEVDYWNGVTTQLDAVVRQHPEAAKSKQLAFVLKKKGSFSQAIKVFEDSINQYEEDVKAGKQTPYDRDELRERHSGVAECYCRLNDFAAALKHCDAGIAADPKSPQGYVDRSFIYERLKKPVLARADLAKAKTLGWQFTSRDVMTDYSKSISDPH